MNTFVTALRSPRSTTIGAALGVALYAASSTAPGVVSRCEAGTAVPGGPLIQLRQSNDRIDRLLKAKARADNQRSRDEMKTIVNGFLAYDELARRTLASHWEKLTPAQRDDFEKTLRQLIEKNYVKQLRTNLEYDVVYGNEAVKGDDATVNTTVKVRTKGKSTDTVIDYRLKKKGERWMVYDVVTDEVSMVQNYRTSFNRTIANESFDALLKKMRTKMTELDANSPPAKG